MFLLSMGQYGYLSRFLSCWPGRRVFVCIGWQTCSCLNDVLIISFRRFSTNLCCSEWTAQWSVTTTYSNLSLLFFSCLFYSPVCNRIGAHLACCSISRRKDGSLDSRSDFRRVSRIWACDQAPVKLPQRKLRVDSMCANCRRWTAL